MHNAVAERLGFSRPDHKNRNGFDNRRENLRPATHSQQLQNTRVRVNSRSGFRGVTWNTERNCWSADITIEGKHIFLGRRKSPVEAALLYDAAAAEAFGDFASLNFPNNKTHQLSKL